MLCESEREELRRIEEALSTGATSISIDGRSVSLDLGYLQRRAQTLRARMDGHARRAVRTLDLSGSF